MKYPFIFLSGALLGAIVSITGINSYAGKLECEVDLPNNQKCTLVAVQNRRVSNETI